MLETELIISLTQLREVITNLVQPKSSQAAIHGTPGFTRRFLCAKQELFIDSSNH